MVKIAIVQGRLSSPVGGRYQHFPIHSWREEFVAAADLGFDGIEWIVSDFSNPLFDPLIIDQALEITEKTGVRITSVSLDVLMHHPYSLLDWGDITWLFDRVCSAVSLLNIQRISIPIEENSGIRSFEDAVKVRGRLAKIQKEYGGRIPLISIETDLSVQNLHHLLSYPEIDQLGILVDTGNAAANGYDIEEYFRLCGPRIYGFHIKDRPAFFQSSVPFGDGSAEIAAVLSRWKELPKIWDITLQPFRTPDRFLDNARHALNYVREHIVK